MMKADGKVTLQTQIDTHGLSKGISNLKGQFGALSKAAGSLAKILAGAFAVHQLVKYSQEAVAAAQAQEEAETKLATVMRQRMNATDGMIESVKALAREEQKLGVIGDEVQLAGAQQLATFLNSQKALEKLIPAMNDLAAQQNGLNASQGDLVNIGNLIGKVMQGQTGALTRVGITFSKAEEQVLKYGNEEERAAMLAQVIKNNVGDMNNVLAQTPAGQMKQLKNQLGDIMETFGQGLQNFIVPFLKGLNLMLSRLATLANAFKAFSELITGKKNNSVSAVANGYSDAASGAEDYTNATNDATKATKEATKAQNKYLSGLDEVNTYQTKQANNASNSAAGIGSGGGSAIDYGTIKESETVMDRYSEKMEQFAESFKNAIEPFITTLKDGLAKIDWSKITGSLDNLWESLIRFSQSVVYDGLLWLWQNVLVPLGTWTMNEVVPRFFDTLAFVIQIVTGALLALKPLWQWFFDNVLQPVATFTASVFLTAWDKINGVLGEFAQWCQDNPEIIENVALAIGTFFAAFKVAGFVVNAIKMVKNIGGLVECLGALKGAISTVVTGFNPWMLAIAAAITAGVLLWKNWDTVKEKAVEIWGKIQETIKRISGNITRSVEEFKTSIENVWTKIKTNTSNAWDAIKTKIETKIGEAIEKGKEIIGTLKDKVDTVFGAIKEAVKGLKTTFINMKDSIKNTFDNLEQIIKAPINGIISAVNALVNGVTNAINGVINALNHLSFTIPSWVPGYGGNSLGFNMTPITAPHIPYLATGAVIPPNAPFTAVLGDQRNGNNIEAPEALLRQIVSEESGGNGNYRFTAQINRRTLFDELISEARLRQTTSGRNPFEMA